MSYKDGYKKDLGTAAPEPAGSLAPMTSTMDGSKWHHGVDGAGIARLTKISAEINGIVDETSKSVAKAQIKVGRLLNDARALIPGDLQFGKWREANTTITNKSTANKLMNLAKQVGEGRITQELIDALPMSTLKELISAPDSVLAYIRDALVEDPAQVPTRNEVRDLVRGDKEQGDPAEITGKEGMHEAERRVMATQGDNDRPDVKTKAPTAPVSPPAPKIDHRSIADRIIRMPIQARFGALDTTGNPPFPGCKPVEWAWMLFGLDIDPAILPNIAVIDTLREHYIDCCADEDIIDTNDILGAVHAASMVDRAYDLIKGDY